MIRDYVFPILALSLICLVMAGALALVNDVTYPVIQEAAAVRQFEAMQNIIPAADEFAAIDLAPFPDSIVAAYRALNGAGYIFVARARGFGGEMRIMSGLTANGEFIASTVLAHSETISFANRVFGYRDMYEARGQNLLDVDAISGATLTFRAYQQALNEALRVFEIAREGAN